MYLNKGRHYQSFLYAKNCYAVALQTKFYLADVTPYTKL